MEHGAVTNTVAPLEIRRVEDGLHLVHKQVTDPAGIGAFRGDSQNAPALLQERRGSVLDKTHEGFDRDQPGVASTGAIVPLSFKVLQEVHHERSIKLFKIQRRRRYTKSLAGKLKQQLEGIGIAVAGMFARTPL